MISFDTTKKYVLVKFIAPENGIYNLGNAVAITFSDTEAYLKALCHTLGYELYVNYPVGYGEFIKYDIIPTDEYIHEVNKYLNDYKSNDHKIVIPYESPNFNIDDIKVGDEVIVPHDEYGEIDFVCIGKDHDGPGTTTLLTKYLIDTVAFDSEEPNHRNRKIREYGNNRYRTSNLLQWMNSDKPAVKWYTPQHANDTPPNGIVYNYLSKPGLLYGFSEEFKSQLVTVKKETLKNDVLYNGGIEYVSSKLFLLSTTEIGVMDTMEGSIYEYFNKYGNDVIFTYPTYDKEKRRPPEEWWLRTPSETSSSVEYLAGGLFAATEARFTHGLRFALVMKNR